MVEEAEIFKCVTYGTKQARKKELLFVNKKKQKNFDFFDVTAAGAPTPRSGAEVFWFFFSKKNIFFPCVDTIMVYFTHVTEKRTPTYDLEAFKNATVKMRVTLIATRTAAALGFGRNEINALIQTMQRQHFYKSMTSHANHLVWQDVYHVPSPIGLLYVKFTADAVTEFALLSFKEKDNG